MKNIIVIPNLHVINSIALHHKINPTKCIVLTDKMDDNAKIQKIRGISGEITIYYLDGKFSITIKHWSELAKILYIDL